MLLVMFGIIIGARVALLAEGVDRNFELHGVTFGRLVALLAEGVDRNPDILAEKVCVLRRPPRGGRG